MQPKKPFRKGIFILIIVVVATAVVVTYLFVIRKEDLSISVTRNQDQKATIEYVSKYGYKFQYPKNFRLAEKLTNHLDGEVIILTTVSDSEEGRINAKVPRSDEGEPLISTHDILSKFSGQSIIVSPGYGGTDVIIKSASSESREKMLKKFGYLGIDYTNVEEVVSIDGTAGVKYVDTPHALIGGGPHIKDGTIEDGAPMVRALFPFKHDNIFPKYGFGSDESSIIMFTILKNSPEETKSAFQRIISTLEIL